MSPGESELADPRLISTRDLESTLGGTISEALIDVRNSMFERLRAQYGDETISAVSNFDGIARSATNVALSGSNVRRQSRIVMEDAIERTLDRLDSQVHSPKIDVPFGSRHQQQARFVARGTDLDVRAASEDMLDRTRTQVRNAALRGESMDEIEQRVRDRFSDSEIERRSKLIARMNIQSAIETTKLSEYEASPEVDGIRIINPCTQNTSRLCRDLAGCGPGDAVVAWFDDERSITQQLMEHIDDDLMFQGFQPLPPVPPWHFNCRSEIAPATRQS